MYNIIYADPPWQFGSKQVQTYNGERFNPLSREYQSMSTHDIKALHVPYLADLDCALFLWTTDAHIPDALDVIQSWGFKYSTIAFVWRKLSITGKTFATVGPWVMKNCELCMLATKGKMLQYKQTNNIYQLVEAERFGHSQKPEEVASRIEQLFGSLPKIELFARQRRSGWDCWGDETISDIPVDHDDWWMVD